MSERRIGILIASSRFPEESKLEDLRFPENDVDGLNEILTSQDHGQFTQTFLLKNKLHHEILLKINQVLREADKNDLVLIYYSGHGKLNPAGKLHLTSTDSVINALEATSIPVSTIRDYVDISSSNKIVLILDCCFSGAAGEAFARGGVDDQLHLVSGGRGTYILTASTGIQVAQEKESDQYGVFTKHLIEGIKSGEADLDSDGRITMGDLYRYVHDKVLDEGFQEPMKWDLNVRGEMVIARSGKTPLAERRKKILKMLYNLAADGILPEDILDKARRVIALEPNQLSEEDRTYDRLLDQLLNKRLEPVEFIRKWDKVRPGKPSLQTKEQEEERRIDAVAPSNASVGQSMNVFVQVRFPDSEYLRLEDWPFKNRPSLIEQSSKSTKVRYSKDFAGKLVPSQLRIKVVAPEFKIEGESEKRVAVQPKKFSELISFQLIPKSSGIHGIMINVCDENGIYVGELPVETDVYEQKKPSIKEATIVVLALNVLVNLEPAKISEQAGDERQQEQEQKRETEKKNRRKEKEELKRKAEEERTRTEAEAKGKAEEEQKVRAVKEEIKLEKPKPVKIRPSEPKPDIKAPPEPKSSEPHKKSNALKFAMLTGVALLLIAGIWWWVSQQHEKDVRQEIEKFDRHALNLEHAVANIDKPEQVEELYRQRDTLNQRVEGFSEQAAQAGLGMEMEELQNRLNQIQIQLANMEKEFFPAPKGKIFLESVPENAIVKILNIDQGFQQGMELEPGKYHVEVSSEGYEPQDRWIELGPGEERQINFELKKIILNVARLHVETFPEEAMVRILNIGPKFEQGLELEPGRYHVEVAAEGYETQRLWVDLVAGHEEPFSFELEKIKPAQTTSPDSPNPLEDPRVQKAIRILLQSADRDAFEHAKRLLWEAGYSKSITLSRSQLRLPPKHEELLIERLGEIRIKGIIED